MSRRKPGRGFTLIEVLVSIVLSGIAMIGVIALYRASTSASAFSRRGTEAAVLAQDRLEKLRSEAAPLAGSSTPEVIDETGKPIVGGPFTRFYNVTTTANYSEIAVTVTFTDVDIPRSIVVRGRRNL